MRKIHLWIFILVQITCTAQDIVKNPVAIEYKVERIKVNEFDLFLSFKIQEPYKIISPTSLDDFFMRTEIHFNDSTYFGGGNNWIEIPAPEVEFDSMINENIRVHKGEVILTKRIKLLTNMDFKVKGYLNYQSMVTKLGKKGKEVTSFLCEDNFIVIKEKGEFKIMKI